MSSESRSHRPWFQDERSGCEKQTHYFVRIRKLQDELINREQHNLINAMERLRQISNPKKRATGLAPEDGGFDPLPRSSQSFPSRLLNLRKQAKHKPIPKYGKPDLKPVSGKPLIPEREKNTTTAHQFFTLPLLTDTDIAKIVHNANYGFSREPSTYLLQPHLPSIPNVGRKANFVLDNRLRLLTLAGGDSEFNEGSVTGTTKKIHKAKPKKIEDRDDCEKKPKSSGTKKRNKNRQVLRFDIDINDPSIFSHCVNELEGTEEDPDTPLPPPNSRPSSTKLRVGQSCEDMDMNEDKKADDSQENIGLATDDAQESTATLAAVPTQEMPLENDQSDEVQKQPNDDRGEEKVGEEFADKVEHSEGKVGQESEGQSVTEKNDLALVGSENDETANRDVVDSGNNLAENTELLGESSEQVVKEDPQ